MFKVRKTDIQVARKHKYQKHLGCNSSDVFVPNTHENLDLWGNGLATPGNPITLWWTWNGLHQTWNFTEGTGFM